MDKNVFKTIYPLKGEITVPADKSISHRAVILAALAKGKSVIKNFSKGKDPITSLNVCRALGIKAELKNDLTIVSDGKLFQPQNDLDCQNSGTTMRIMTGILACQNFNSVLIGDKSLSKRPMKRIIQPLSLMGADIISDNNHAPLKISGHNLFGINYSSHIASAQVKSAVLLAGLNASGKTVYTEPCVSRDHTERLLKYMGAYISSKGNTITIEKSDLNACNIEICGDISSAAFFIVSALIVPNSNIILKNIGLNPSRTGIIEIAQKAGADIKILDKREVCNEPAGDIQVKYSHLKGFILKGDIIPKLIDELPVIAVLATQAEGTTIIKDASDLRNKESDRISCIVSELKKLGANIEETPDGFTIQGRTKLKGGCEVQSFYDHRMAMSLFVAGLICENPITIKGFEWVNISFPEFEQLFANITKY